MIGQKKKFSKKEMKEDKLVTTYYKVVAFYEENKRNIAYVVGGIAIVVLAFFLYSENKKTDNEVANIELDRLIEGRAGTPLIGFKKLVDQYGSTEIGETAKIYLANSYYFLGKFDEALKYYQDFSGSNDVFKASAFAGQAACFEAKNEQGKAAELYHKAATVSKQNVLNPQYLLFAGINYIKTGKKDEAKEILTRLKKDFTTSTYTREVDKYLAQIQ
jgi:tetratricopeptide (TPR) repeat protein